jgi:signal transduction histidine kinase
MVGAENRAGDSTNRVGKTAYQFWPPRESWPLACESHRRRAKATAPVRKRPAFHVRSILRQCGRRAKGIRGKGVCRHIVKERVWFSALLELLVACACLLLGFGEQGLVTLIGCLLACACLLAAKLLVELLKGSVWLTVVLALACVLVVFWYRSDLVLPVLIALLVDILVIPRTHTRLAGTFAAVLVAAVLVSLVFPQSTVSLFGAAAALVLMLAGHVLAQQAAHLASELAAKDERLVELQMRLEHQRSTIATIEQQGRLAERNRLAARIHDKVGHGITGSVLMLEAAQLQLASDPQAARASIACATDNLRESVDDIRRELREERSADTPTSRASIAAALAEFSNRHASITTELQTEGALDTIPQSIWVCIHESLLETLTNVLKHTTASHFRVFISHINRLVYVEFGDTGDTGAAGGVAAGGGKGGGGGAGVASCPAPGVARGATPGGGGGAAPRVAPDATATAATTTTAAGLGLVGIEERVALSGGKVFFSQTPCGFKTKMTFTIRGATTKGDLL